MTDTLSAEAETDAPVGEILIVTEAARDAVLAVRAREDDADTLGLRVAVTGISGIDYTYDLALEPVADAAADDHLHTSGELTVMVPDASVGRLVGSTLDVPSADAQGGLVIRNPNRPNPLGDMDRLELSGSIAEKVQQLLDMSVNPALASHGGYATLEEVRADDTVVVKMGGGCQGCAMSQATLSDGIKRAIMEAIPEVVEVLDATDHEAGANPYFT